MRAPQLAERYLGQTALPIGRLNPGASYAAADRTGSDPTIDGPHHLGPEAILLGLRAATGMGGQSPDQKVHEKRTWVPSGMPPAAL